MQDLSTPLAYVEFWTPEGKQTVRDVIARDTTDTNMVVVKCADGSFWAFRHWTKFVQSPGPAFFE